MKTRITELLHIEYPIIQGAMAWVADHHLAAAVSEAGGLGIIAGGGAPADHIKNEIHKARALTKKPLGVNIMLLSPFADDLAQLVIDEKIEVVTTGAGSPSKYIEKWKAAGITVIPVVASTALAKKMERMGADAVIAEGSEAGGHIGEITTMCLVPQVADVVSIPIIAAGGIADGRGMAAAFALGCDGVQCGTIFLTAHECNISETYKEVILKAGDIASVVTGRSTGHPVRSVKSPMTRELLKMEQNNATFEELELLSLGSLRKAVVDGNYKEGSFMSGQIAGLVNTRRSVDEILEALTSGAVSVMKRLGE